METSKYFNYFLFVLIVLLIGDVYAQVVARPRPARPAPAPVPGLPGLQAPNIMMTRPPNAQWPQWQSRILETPGLPSRQSTRNQDSGRSNINIQRSLTNTLSSLGYSNETIEKITTLENQNDLQAMEAAFNALSAEMRSGKTLRPDQERLRDHLVHFLEVGGQHRFIPQAIENLPNYSERETATFIQAINQARARTGENIRQLGAALDLELFRKGYRLSQQCL